MPEDTFSTMRDAQTFFREVTPDQLFPEKWKEFTVNIGGTQALQEIKVPERAGGYAYKDQVKLYTRNRFLYWRISHDTLELVEHSLDVNLTGNALRYRFQDTPVLEGVSIHETDRAVVVLLATVSSVHKLTFPHPDYICTEESADFALTHHPDIGIKSILADASLAAVRDPASFYVLNNVGSGSALPYISASLFTMEGDCLFALGYPSGMVLLVRMSAGAEEVSVRELKEDTYVPHFLSGLTKSFMGGRGISNEAAVSLVLHCIGLEAYLFCLYRDGVLSMWSCGQVTCISSIDMVQMSGSEPGHRITEGVQNHVLRKAHDSRDSHLLLAVYLCFASGSQVCLVKPIYQPGFAYKLSFMCTIHAPASDLVDLALSSKSLWAVWRGSTGQPLVSRAVLGGELSPWQMALLESAPDVEAGLRDDMDVSEQYLSYIFQGSHFSVPVITRALALFRRSTLMPEATLSYSKLRERVSRAVEAEIQKVAQGVEMTDEDYMEVAYQSWSRFYSDCVQYNEKSMRPIGLMQLGESGVALIKRQQYSLLRPMELLEQLLLMPGVEVVPSEPSSPSLELEAPSVELVRLMCTLSLLEQRCAPELKTAFQTALEESLNPEHCVADLLHGPPSPETESLLNPSFLNELGCSLQAVGDVYDAVSQLLQILSLEVASDESEIIQDSLAPGGQKLLPPFLGCLFASSVGNNVVAQSLLQVAMARLAVCRNLLLLLHLLLELRQLVGMRLDTAQLDALRSSLTPHIVILTQAYHSIVWLGNTVAARVSRATLETTSEQLAVLGLSRLAPPPAAAAVSATSRPPHVRCPLDQRPPTLLELLMQGCACVPARCLLSARNPGEDALAHWPTALLPYMMCLGKVVSPISSHLAVPQLLLAMSQRRLVMEYVQLLATWCEWNSCQRQFALGAAQLYSGEPHKALDTLLGAAHRGPAETLLEQLQGAPLSSSPDSHSPLVQYYMLLIKMFTHLKHWDCVLTLAETGVAQASGDNELSTLNLVAFTAHLRLGHHTHAFNSLVAIPDRERSRLCLRQLVTTMFECLQLDALLEFPHQSLFDDLESIVQQRARALDLNQTAYYNFLYSFHMKQGNVRKAATAMLEQALRLGAEMPATLSNVQRRANCYLACLNALRLAAPGFQWLVRPALKTKFVGETKERYESHRRMEDAEVFALSGKTNVELSQLGDIEGEYELVNAHLSLIKLNSPYFSSSVGDMSPGETVTACMGAGLYEVALTVGKRFNISLEPVFCFLARTCVDMTQKGQINAEETWIWLKENDVWEFGIGDANALDLSWKLLEVLLTQYEEENCSNFHKAVTMTLLKRGSFLPHWLVASYRQRNPAELLRLLVNSGRLEEAAALGQRLLWAALGRGSYQEFGLPGTLRTGGPILCLPIYTLDHLLLELENAAKQYPAVYSEALKELRLVRDKYVSEAVNATEQLKYRAQVSTHLAIASKSAIRAS